MVWFIPMVAMDVTGFELTLLIFTLLGIVACKRCMRLFARHYPLLLPLGILVGFSSQLYPYCEFRVIITSIGSLIVFLCFLARVWYSSEDRKRAVTGFLLGMFALLGVKFYGCSLDFQWGRYPSSELFNYLSTSLLVAMPLLYWLRAPQVTSPEGCYAQTNTEVEENYAQKPEEPKPKQGFLLGFLAVVAIAEFFYLTESLLMHSSTLSRWVDLPTMPHSFVVIAACALGIVLSELPVAGGRLWSFFAVASTVAIFNMPVPFNFIAGIVHILCITSAAHLLFDLAAAQQPSCLWLFGVLQALLHATGIFIVAYNFATFFPPLGKVLREHNAIFYVCVTATFCLCVMRLRATTPCAKLGGHTKAKRSVLLRLGLLFVLCGVFVPASVHRLLVWPSPPPQSGNYEPNSTISTMIWAVHFGYDNYGQNNFHDLARKIRDANVQVVGLLETDLARPFNANWDVVEWLGEELNMYTNYGPPTMKNTWGVAMLSAYPILSANHSFLPSPNGELAAFIDAQILVQGKQVRVIVAHFGNHPDVYDRQLQANSCAFQFLPKLHFCPGMKFRCFLFASAQHFFSFIDCCPHRRPRRCAAWRTRTGRQ
eukprot:TRINITY_DN1299_c0_g1_i4.p1 TRINITY_DN1299_c0_g1~~TRINITY_DN1299_c0_g1_i4.p1  ORF type:complete len:636 (-),score=109.56 TRINITY_DN1299_c0_g1_i4:362-2152(-)